MFKNDVQNRAARHQSALLIDSFNPEPQATVSVCRRLRLGAKRMASVIAISLRAWPLNSFHPSQLASSLSAHSFDRIHHAANVTDADESS